MINSHPTYLFRFSFKQGADVEQEVDLEAVNNFEAAIARSFRGHALMESTWQFQDKWTSSPRRLSLITKLGQATLSERMFFLAS